MEREVLDALRKVYDVTQTDPTQVNLNGNKLGKLDISGTDQRISKSDGSLVKH